MQPENVRTAADARKIVEERKLDHVKVGVFDNDGIMRGKYMGRDKFFSALDKGFGFCDVVLGWDSNDQLYDNVKYTGWHTAYPDAPVRVLPDTCRNVPFEGDMVMFLGEFAEKAEAVCPRATLRRVLARRPTTWLQGERRHRVRILHVQGNAGVGAREGLSQPDHHDAGLLRLLGAALERAFGVLPPAHEACAPGLRIPLEGLHTETGPGVLEAAIQYCEALEAADRGALFKTYTKVLAQRNGMMATFMAKWSKDWPGQSGHIHTSLTRKSDGKAAFHDAGEAAQHVRRDALVRGRPAEAHAGVVSHGRLHREQLLAPDPRILGADHGHLGRGEPHHARLRVIPGGASSQRVEYRIAAADINPYLALAVAIGSGLHGIENKIEPDPMVEGNAYDKKFPKNRSLPRTLTEASEWLEKSKAGRALFGDAFVEHYAASREWEDREFRRAITDWELARYFEII